MDGKAAGRWPGNLPANTLPPVIILGESGRITERQGRTILAQRDIDLLPSDAPEYHNIDSDIAYILYTSGSTGSPKGVMISHLNITNYINCAVESFNICADDVVLSTAPFHFDMSTFDVFVFKAGGRLAIAREDLLLFPWLLEAEKPKK